MLIQTCPHCQQHTLKKIKNPYPGNIFLGYQDFIWCQNCFRSVTLLDTKTSQDSLLLGKVYYQLHEPLTAQLAEFYFSENLKKKSRPSSFFIRSGFG